MPTYYPLQTTVQLCASSLADSTTSLPERQKGRYATAATEKAESVVKNGRVLKETPIALGDDDARLHFIGPNGEMPFYLLHAAKDVASSPGEETVVERALGKLRLLELQESRPSKPIVPSFSTMSTLTSLDSDVDFSELETVKEDAIQEPIPKVASAPTISPTEFALEIEKRRAAPIERHGLPAHKPQTPAATPGVSFVPTNQHSLRHNSAAQDTDTSLIPQALGLSLTFSDQTFSRSFGKPNALQDVKTDVYVNGELTASTTAPARGVGEFKSKAAEESKVPLFSGKRVHRMAERAMVLVPPHQHADGSMRMTNRSKASLAGSEERWNQVNAAILEEANKLGFDADGKRSPVGAYLASVAALPMPLAVENLQKPGGPKFGVVDVVISVGSGWKLGPTSPYIMEPTRMMNDEFVSKAAKRSEIGDTLPIAVDSAL